MTRYPLKFMINRTILIFEIVNFQFHDGGIIYVSQLTHFSKVCSNVADINSGNIFVVSKELKQTYRYHKLRIFFSKFYHIHS